MILTAALQFGMLAGGATLAASGSIWHALLAAGAAMGGSVGLLNEIIEP